MAMIWRLLEEAAPDGCDDVQDLFSWSLNYDSGQSPWDLFVDLIGWSAESYGRASFDLNEAHRTLGYVELSKLADALTQYSDRPQDVREYVDTLMSADS